MGARESESSWCIRPLASNSRADNTLTNLPTERTTRLKTFSKQWILVSSGLVFYWKHSVQVSNRWTKQGHQRQILIVRSDAYFVLTGSCNWKQVSHQFATRIEDPGRFKDLANFASLLKQDDCNGEQAWSGDTIRGQDTKHTLQWMHDSRKSTVVGRLDSVDLRKNTFANRMLAVALDLGT